MKKFTTSNYQFCIFLFLGFFFLSVTASYAQISSNTISGPSSVCAGYSTTISGSAPSGGNGTYTYTWLSSTTGSSAGYSQATGYASGQSYSTSTTMVANTWFRRLVTSGSFSDTSAPLQITPIINNTWLGTTNQSWGIGSNWSCGMAPTAVQDVTIDSTFRTPALIDIRDVHNLTINSGATLLVNSSTSLLSIYGSLTVNGTLTHSAGTIGFGGTNQTIPALSYYNLSLFGTGIYQPAADLTLNGVLYLHSGALQLGNQNLTIAGSAFTPTYVGSPGGFVITDGTGKLTIKNIGSSGRSGSIVFPVGSSASSYTPLTLINSGTSDDFSVQVKDSAYTSYSGNTPTGTTVTSNVVNKTWFVDEASNGGSNATITLQWNASDELSAFSRSNCYVAHYKNANWSPSSAAAAAGSGPYTRSRSGITSFSPFGIGGSGSLLPVHLVNFNVNTFSGGVVAEWATAAEVNNAMFELQRSTDGISYISVGLVEGNGTTNLPHSYTYYDQDILSVSTSTLYYRLLQHDFNKKTSALGTRIVNLASASGNDAYLYPNPATPDQLLTLQLPEQVTGIVQISICDYLGRHVTTSEHLLTERQSKITIPASLLMKKGIYQVQVQASGYSRQLRCAIWP